MSKKLLFILKKRQIYSDVGYHTVNSSLYNSAMFVNKMLQKNGIESNLVEVVDNNEIDKVVTEYKPDTVIIEALWVVPNKFEVLQKLHPNVKWMIRLHSEIPFIANEGVAIEWLKEYVKYKNVYISANSKVFIEGLEPILGHKIVYTPNYYEVTYPPIGKNQAHKNEIHIGLFGAIRPMKNSLTQAIAAMIYADKVGKKLHLHINTERVEQKGENVLKNIRALFEGTKHVLVEHPWLKHQDFIKLVAKMDLGLQVSLTETYNIVSADFINQEIPIVTSDEVPFVLTTISSPKNVTSIVEMMGRVIRNSGATTLINKTKLKIDSKLSQEQWLKLFK